MWLQLLFCNKKDPFAEWISATGGELTQWTETIASTCFKERQYP